MQHMTPLLRAPHMDELDALARLCWRSKAFWGYSPEFMAACAHVLRVDPAWVASGWVAVGCAQDVPKAVAAISVDGAEAELELMFVAPEAHGRGLGRALMTWATQTAHARGAQVLRILSDPGARGFYQRVGARFLQLAPSDAIAGRMLPLLEMRLV